MKQIAVGTEATIAFMPGPAHTADAIGNPGVMAISTPAILGFLEQTSLQAVSACHDPDEVSVGAHVTLDHCAPAFPGRDVVCAARVTSVSGRRISFVLEARQGDVLVARADYVRVFVPAMRFSAPPKQDAGEPITLWFDFHSPWSYLAVARLPGVAARHGRALRLVPVHVARLIAAIDGRKPLEATAAFVRWYQQDLQDWAVLAGIDIRYHPDFPLRPARALRAAGYAIEAGAGLPFILAVMRAYWTESRDIADPQVLGDVAASVGMGRGAVIHATTDERRKRQLAEQTNDAIAAAVFGVPSFACDGKLYFGNDRIDLLDRGLQMRSARSTAP